MMALVAEIAAGGSTILMTLLGLTVYSQRNRVVHIGVGRARIEMDRPVPATDSLDPAITRQTTPASRTTPAR